MCVSGERERGVNRTGKFEIFQKGDKMLNEKKNLA